VGFNLFSGSAQSEQRLKLSATCSSGRLTRLPTRKPSQARVARQFPLPPSSFKPFGYHMYLICTQKAFELYILIWLKIIVIFMFDSILTLFHKFINYLSCS